MSTGGGTVALARPIVPGIVNADVDAAAAIAKSKLAALDILNVDVNAAAAIAKSKLAALNIVNADVDAAAAIAQSKIAGLAASLAAKADAGWFKIGEVVTGGVVANIDFAAIPATFRHLLFLYTLRTNVAAATEVIHWSANADVNAANYDGELLSSSGGATVTVETRAAIAARTVANVPGNTAQANGFGQGELLIVDYANAARFKTAFWRCTDWNGRGPGAVNFVQGFSGWANVAAINEVTFTPLTGSFIAGCAIDVYGLLAGV